MRRGLFLGGQSRPHNQMDGFQRSQLLSFISIYAYPQGLKGGRVARVGDPAPFDLPGL